MNKNTKSRYNRGEAKVALPQNSGYRRRSKKHGKVGNCSRHVAKAAHDREVEAAVRETMINARATFAVLAAKVKR
jgi:hypothetical protein